MAAATSRLDNATAKLANPPNRCSGETAPIEAFSQNFASARVPVVTDFDLFWHVARNVGECERRVRECLRRANYEVYFPLIRELRPAPKRQLSHAQRASGLPLMREVLAACFRAATCLSGSAQGDRRWRDPRRSSACLRGSRPRPGRSRKHVRALQVIEIDGALPGSMPVREFSDAL
ncbi:MAG: hypothetical protein R3D62_04125 [Xanthobacteraceae bacterium]